MGLFGFADGAPQTGLLQSYAPNLGNPNTTGGNGAGSGPSSPPQNQLGLFGQAQQPTPTQMTSYANNAPNIQPGASNFNTQLPPLQESGFRNWVGQNNIPFNPNAGGMQNYDMRGLYNGMMNNHPQAQGFDASSGVFPHFWTTPFHSSFSNQSQWAGPNAPAPTAKGWLGDR